MSTANDLTQAAKEEFLDRNRNLLALTKNGANDVFRRISAALALDSEAQTDVLLYADAIDQKGYAGSVARDDFKRTMYRAICVAFLRIQQHLVVTFAAKLTPEALAELEAIEVTAGVRKAPAPIAPPPPPLTAAEQLAAQVRRDWVHLRTAEVKRKLNNRAYKAMFDKLMAADQLKSQVTSYTDGAAEFKQ